MTQTKGNNQDSEAEGNEIVARVGKRIKERRKILSMSIKELAALTGLSSSLISRIENGFISPSISTLHLVSANLGVDIGYFFRIDDRKGFTISYRNKRRAVNSKKDEYLIESLANGMENAFMDVAIITMEPGKKPEPELIQHNGQEFLYILEGRVELTLGSEKFVLNKEDAAYFLCEIPHGNKTLSKKASRVLHVHLIPGKRQKRFDNRKDRGYPDENFI